MSEHEMCCARSVRKHRQTSTDKDARGGWIREWRRNMTRELPISDGMLPISSGAVRYANSDSDGMVGNDSSKDATDDGGHGTGCNLPRCAEMRVEEVEVDVSYEGPHLWAFLLVHSSDTGGNKNKTYQSSMSALPVSAWQITTALSRVSLSLPQVLYACPCPCRCRGHCRCCCWCCGCPWPTVRKQARRETERRRGGRRNWRVHRAATEAGLSVNADVCVMLTEKVVPVRRPALGK
jgi:hypothetical protein